MSINNGVQTVVSIVVVAVVAAALLPVAISQMMDVDTSAWDSGVANLFDVLTIIIVLAILLVFIGIALRESDF